MHAVLDLLADPAAAIVAVDGIKSTLPLRLVSTAGDLISMTGNKLSSVNPCRGIVTAETLDEIGGPALPAVTPDIDAKVFYVLTPLP